MSCHRKSTSMVLCSCTSTLSTSSSSSCPSWARATRGRHHGNLHHMGCPHDQDSFCVCYKWGVSFPNGRNIERLLPWQSPSYGTFGSLELRGLLFGFPHLKSKERMLLCYFTAWMVLTEVFAYSLFWGCVVFFWLVCLPLYIKGCFH